MLKPKVLVSILLLSALAAGCSGPVSTTTFTVPPATSPGGLVILSDSVDTVQLMTISGQTTGYPWKVEVKIISSQQVGTLVNPVKDKTGLTVTCYTDQDMNPFKEGQTVSTRIKYAGDVPVPGIVLYIYDIS